FQKDEEYVQPQPEEQVVIENDQVQPEEQVLIEIDQVHPRKKAIGFPMRHWT
ncbi:hypothetical protein A2U01_0105433, partial [Trifolium medium]|nr:hypothetical protein [Trifolium medium]